MKFKYSRILLAIFLVVIIKILYAPIRDTLGLHAEMGAEGALLYFDCAFKQPLSICLFQTDMGYLPFFARIASAFLNFVSFDLRYLPLAQQIVALVTAVVSCAALSHSLFRPIFGGNFSRLLLACVAAMQYDYDLHTFINASYFLFLPSLASSVLFIINPNQPKKWVGFFGLITGLAIASKGTLIILAVFGFIALFRFFITKNFKNFSIYIFPLALASYLQVTTLLRSREVMGNVFINMNAPLPELLWSSISSFTQGFLNFFGLYKANAYLLAISFVLVLYLLTKLIITSLMKVRLRGLIESEALPNQIAVGSFVAAALIAHILIVKGAFVYKTFAFPELKEFPQAGRMWFLQSSSLLMGLWVLIRLLKRFLESKYKYHHNNSNLAFKLISICCIAFIITHGMPFRISSKNIVNEPIRAASFSNWEQFYKYLDSTSFCIPVNPYPWIYSKNCRLLSYPNFSFTEHAMKTENTVIDIEMPKHFEKEKINLFAFFHYQNVGKNFSAGEFLAEVICGREICKSYKSIPTNKSGFVFFKVNDEIMLSKKIKLKRKDGGLFSIETPGSSNPSSSIVWMSTK